MSLTFSPLAGGPSDECFQIARDTIKKIYYCTQSIDIFEETPNQENTDISEIIDDIIMENELYSYDNMKALQLEDDIKMRSRPSDRISKLLYDQVLNIIIEQECKLYRSPHGKIKVVPRDIEGQRTAIYISGQSGSGKSTWASDFAKEYTKLHPHNRIIIISGKPYDPIIDGVLDNLVRVKLDKEFLRYMQNPGDKLEEARDSLIIFDDFQAITDKHILEAVIRFKNLIYEMGRSYHIDVISISHKGLGGGKTITDLCEANYIVCFVEENLGETKKILKNYCHYNDHQISRILDKEGRASKWMCIIRAKTTIITPTYIKIIGH